MGAVLAQDGAGGGGDGAGGMSAEAAGWWALSAPGGILEQLIAVDESEGLRYARTTV
eukprot:COSAG05_NODE_3094_length_2326_cov_10.375842_5_plen_57_part_00